MCGLEPTLPHVAGFFMPQVVSNGMGREKPLHPASDVAILSRSHDQVKVVWHQAHGENRQFDALLSLGHQFQELGVVTWLVKHFGLSIRAVEHVIVLAGEYAAGRTRHVPQRNPRAYPQWLTNRTRSITFGG